MKRSLFRGCLIAGACGDALGARVEFMGQMQIFKRFGPRGITEIGTNYDAVGGITDDTQMTLFTAEGLIAFLLPFIIKSVRLEPPMIRAEETVPAVHQSYLRWLKTQGYESVSPAYKDEVLGRGWIIQQTALHSPRAPGNTCLGALASGSVGSPRHLINNSKGCGGVMRVAPCALFVCAGFPELTTNQQMDLAFQLGCSAAAITHTHATGWLSSGCLASIIVCILMGESLEESIKKTVLILKQQPKHEECLRKIDQAVELATSFNTQFLGFKEASEAASAKRQKLVTEHIKRIGGGWIGEEALAVALYCCLISAHDLETAIIYAVNHGGDSDSTGAIAGNILGAALGDSAIPPRWKNILELHDVIEIVSDDLFDVLEAGKYDILTPKYPPAVMTLANGVDLGPYYVKQVAGDVSSMDQFC